MHCCQLESAAYMLQLTIDRRFLSMLILRNGIHM